MVPYLTYSLPLAGHTDADDLHVIEPSASHLDALNALQSTPCRVNERTLAVMAQAWEENSRIGAMPDRENIALPEYVGDYNYIPEAEKKKLDQQRAIIHQRNEREQVRRGRVWRALSVAKKFEH